ncbi:MAG: hypothetical protein RL693_2335, partial [Verrucomicrobiota bacterium]
ALLFLAHQTDDEALTTWIDRFSLFDWSAQHASKTLLRKWSNVRSTAPSPDASTLLYTFFRPHFDNATLAHQQTQANGGDPPPKDKVIAKAGRLSAIIAALDGGNISTAWANAAAAYRAERVAIADFADEAFAHNNPRRLLASLIFPVNYSGLNELAKRWQSPSTHNTQKPRP